MMLLVLAVALGVLAWALRLPARVTVALVVALWAAAILAHLALPDGHAIRGAIGGDARVWGAAGVVAALVLAYRQGLAALRARSRPADRPAPPAPAAVPTADDRLSDDELDRYARHIVLREIGGTGQRRLKAARVLVIGAGGLGSPALLYLAAAGIGRITVIDDDTVSVSNLQRQILFATADAGRPKTEAAAERLRAINPHVTVAARAERLTEANAGDLMAGQDLILDGSDNFDTRYLANRAAVAASVPLVSAAITQWEGQIGLYDPARGGACYQCVFPERPAPGLAPPCAEAGVVGPLPGVLGAMMALEAVKHLTGAGQGLRGHLLIYDGLWGETRRIATRPRPDCPVCGQPGRAGP